VWGAGPDQALAPTHDAGTLRELCAGVGLAISGMSVEALRALVFAAAPSVAATYDSTEEGVVPSPASA
jgi:hypothetical protein